MVETTRFHLNRGTLLPKIITPPPGPRSLALSHRLAAFEAPGINTLYQDQPNIVWHEALGSNVLDVDGNRYIDMTSGFGVAAVGHRHPAIVQALRHQSSRLIHALGDAMGHELRIELAEHLVEISPVPNPQVYFAISGADAIEISLKTAILYTKRPKFLVFEPSYHGLTLGALCATSRPEFRNPFTDHLHTQSIRLPYACPISMVEKTVAELPDLGAILVEPIVGREGVLIPPRGWLTELSRLTKNLGILLIVDEIFTGGGRTGHFFAIESEFVEPDLLVCGKAIAGGLPIGAVVGRTEVLESWRTSGEALHTATFVAHPLACATALAALGVIRDQSLVARAANLGASLEKRLSCWQTKYPSIREVRGRGLLWGIEFHRRSFAEQISSRARSRGHLLLAGGPDGVVLQLAPALTIEQRQLDCTLNTLEDILEHF